MLNIKTHIELNTQCGNQSCNIQELDKDILNILDKQKSILKELKVQSIKLKEELFLTTTKFEETTINNITLKVAKLKNKDQKQILMLLDAQKDSDSQNIIIINHIEKTNKFNISAKLQEINNVGAIIKQKLSNGASKFTITKNGLFQQCMLDIEQVKQIESIIKNSLEQN